MLLRIDCAVYIMSVMCCVKLEFISCAAIGPSLAVWQSQKRKCLIDVQEISFDDVFFDFFAMCLALEKVISSCVMYSDIQTPEIDNTTEGNKRSWRGKQRSLLYIYKRCDVIGEKTRLVPSQTSLWIESHTKRNAQKKKKFFFGGVYCLVGVTRLVALL